MDMGQGRDCPRGKACAKSQQVWYILAAGVECRENMQKNPRTREHPVEQSAVFPENIEELTAEYRRLWPLMPVLHANIGKLATKDAIKACGRRLGMISAQGGKIGLHFEDELEMDVFQDYLLYMHRPRGVSLVRQMRNRKLYPPDSDEQMLLEGMVQARFSLFWVKALHPAGGFAALDVITGEEVFVLDQSMPRKGEIGLLLGFRLFPFRAVWMHTGATMVFGRIDDAAGMQPVGRWLNEQEERELNENNIRHWRDIVREMD
jgi:hypothetical protein